MTFCRNIIWHSARTVRDDVFSLTGFNGMHDRRRDYNICVLTAVTRAATRPTCGDRRPLLALVDLVWILIFTFVYLQKSA